MRSPPRGNGSTELTPLGETQFGLTLVNMLTSVELRDSHRIGVTAILLPSASDVDRQRARGDNADE